MKRNYLVIFISCLMLWGCGAQQKCKFLRNLPSQEFQSKLTEKNFPNQDAVIILNEQSIGGNTERHIKIIKLFNESAVERYGSFEFSYYPMQWVVLLVKTGKSESFIDPIIMEKGGFKIEVNVRVLKPDGSEWVMPEEYVNTIVYLKDASGKVIREKKVVKVPNLTAGDILQIEYAFPNPYIYYSGIYPYNERDIILNSNLYITLPNDIDMEYLSFPANLVGEPEISQMSESWGAGKTYFWSVKNLNPIPDEPFSLPFRDQALLTTFFVRKKTIGLIESFEYGTWKGITQLYYNDYLGKSKVDKSIIKALGLAVKPEKSSLSFADTDSLYYKLKDNFNILDYSDLYPDISNFNDIMDNSKGTATDLAYIMYEIVKKWGMDVQAAWISDKRTGSYEESVPTTAWFDRLGLLIDNNGEQRFYDFDRCLPAAYEFPWFLNNCKVVLINEDGFKHSELHLNKLQSDNIFQEIHHLTFSQNGSIQDKVQLKYNGFPALELRDLVYNMEKSECLKLVEQIAKTFCLKTVDSCTISDFLRENWVELEAEGESVANAETMEKFLTFNLKNHCLASFKDKIFYSRRRSDIIFPGAFTINMKWNIDLPAGYKARPMMDEQFQMAEGIDFKILRKIADDTVQINAIFTVRYTSLSYKHYSYFMDFIDRSLELMGRNITLEKPFINRN